MNQIRSSLTDKPCPINESLQCPPKNRNCETCGWNPKVAKARLEKICKEMGISLPVIQKEEDHGEERSV